MIHALQVHQLVDHHVVAHPVRHLHETPVQADVTVSRARSPSPPLIADADARHGQAVHRGQREQAFGQLASRALATRPLDLRRHPVFASAEPLRFEPMQLLPDPRLLLRGELARPALRTPTRNRHADRAVGAHPDDVPPRAGVAEE